MTVKELREMLATMNDTDVIAFVEKATDRDGFMYEVKNTRYVGIVKADAEPVRRVYGNPIYVERG